MFGILVDVYSLTLLGINYLFISLCLNVENGENNRDMIERKAFFISGERLTSIEHKKKILVIFDMSRDEVVGVETVDIEDRFVSTEELLLFLQKNIFV